MIQTAKTARIICHATDNKVGVEPHLRHPSKLNEHVVRRGSEVLARLEKKAMAKVKFTSKQS